LFVKLGFALVLPTLALRTTATVLRVLAAGGERLADALRSDDVRAPGQTAESAGPSTPVDVEAASPQPTSAEPAVPTPQAIAARTAPEVIAALDDLSAVELGDLYEHESKHRRRRSVLDAITAAAAPPTSAASLDDAELLDDVREPDVLVYSTSTPTRSSVTV
jgi:hypothetical protein